MALSPQEFSIVAALGGAIIGAIPGIVTTFITRRSDERKQIKELVVKAAIESWKTHAAAPGKKDMLPLEIYIVHSAKMCELAFSDKKMSPETMRSSIQEIHALMQVLAE